ncbi:MAG: ATP-grasp domain-containing protein [Acidobacteriia bacterium]|nr:ATP-grasp domain-containing protein [Terriglobia bacterium]
MKRLLLLSTTTGYQAQQFRAAAARMEIPLVLASDTCHAMDDPWGDGAISVRFQKPRESAGKIREFAQHQPIHGLVAIGDAPTVTAALLARDLALRFHPPHAVELCRNKFLARQRYQQAGMRVPWYARFKLASDLAQASRAVPYPCVLKPLGLSASRGAIRANHEREFVAAFRRITALLQQKDVKIMRDESAAWIQVESFIPGREFAVEGLVTRGRLRVLAIFDKPDPLDGPFFEETIYVTPSRLSGSAQQAITDCSQQAITALGLTDGPVHAELRLHDDGPWMLEVAARPIGGLCAGALRFDRDGHPLSLEELILRHALGEPVDGIPRESCASGVMMIPIPHEGFYEGLENLEAAQQVPGIERVEITAKFRQKLVPLPEGASYLGFIFARGPSPQSVEDALRESHRQLAFLISQAIPVI